MSRLTTNKDVSEMSMIELAHNSCYADDQRRARYRDYELDIDARDLAKMLIKDMCNEDLTSMTDEEFDDYIGEMLSTEMDSQIGLIALFYRNLWVMADLRERLKAYEDMGSLQEVRNALKKPQIDKELESHDEKYILKYCISLMNELTGFFEKWYRWVHGENAVEELSEEEKFCCNMSYFHIVQELFLFRTYHSGGSSTMAKCRQLGVDSGDYVTFKFMEEEDDE